MKSVPEGEDSIWEKSKSSTKFHGSEPTVGWSGQPVKLVYHVGGSIPSAPTGLSGFESQVAHVGQAKIHRKLW